MPYVSSGTLTTDKQTIDDAYLWDTQTEWAAYQSKAGVDVSSGVLSLSQFPAGGVARYPLDTNLEDIWNNYDGVNNGIQFTDNATRGGVGVFDGSSAYGNLSALNPVVGGASELSIFAWVLPDTVSSNNIISRAKGVDNADEVLQLYFPSGGELRLILNDGSTRLILTETTNPVEAGSWSFVGFTFGGGSASLYHETTAVQTGSIAGPLQTGNANTLLGALDSSTISAFFDGVMDQVAVYDVKLTQTQVENLYNTGSIDG